MVTSVLESHEQAWTWKITETLANDSDVSKQPANKETSLFLWKKAQLKENKTRCCCWRNISYKNFWHTYKVPASESLMKSQNLKKNGLISKKRGVGVWFGGTRCSCLTSAFTRSCLVIRLCWKRRGKRRPGRTDWRNSKTSYFIWKAALIIKQGRG